MKTTKHRNPTKVAAAMRPLLIGRLVKAVPRDRAISILYGIPIDLKKEMTKEEWDTWSQTMSVRRPQRDDDLWALWTESPEKAVEEYENIESFNKASWNWINVTHYEFHILDEDDYRDPNTYEA